jgi:hypothetical protein
MCCQAPGDLQPPGCVLTQLVPEVLNLYGTLTRSVVFVVSPFWVPTGRFSNGLLPKLVAAAITTTKATTLESHPAAMAGNKSRPAPRLQIRCRRCTVVPREGLLHHAVIMPRERRTLCF